MPSPEASRRNLQKASEGFRKAIAIPPGKNSEVTKHLLQLGMLPEINLDDPQEVEHRTIEFFQICGENDMKPTLEAWATALGVDRTTIINWRNGSRRKNPDVLRVINRYHSILNAQHAQLMEDGDGNAPMSIFLMKNNFDNYRDAQEINVMATQVDAVDKEALADKYADIMDAIDVDFTDVD